VYETLAPPQPSLTLVEAELDCAFLILLFVKHHTLVAIFRQLVESTISMHVLGGMAPISDRAGPVLDNPFRVCYMVTDTISVLSYLSYSSRQSWQMAF
jgi:hypothetical protein